ncbi:MAG: phosphate/phosphite/phosphonate ABC transporter substrate-binding protein [Gammaproteobacteria bacterium]|nr:phosphate/phosphite/phosphonate ABC transporter substrate-binding protein [Gammaproteobacteria bacterium]MDH3371306.1 phosphate/phosphite/phosphonate ABC transporter substrate-binding protein [Gammaproteobacteria bacterium]MDH5486907.1 phosphate/phosphite/phosphonate ABC transporter substrate-binding protein [Gammaproteobacteria bacterium]
MYGFSKRIKNITLALSLGSLLLTAGAKAADPAPGARKTSFSPPEAAHTRPSLEGVARGLPAGADDLLVFSAPPRETEEEGERTYQPIAAYLSRITGKKIVYRHPQNWLTYQTEMQRGSYDLVFDGPHLNGWRISHLRHSTLVKVVGEHAFAVVVRKDNSRVTELKQLAGQKVCGMNPPNLGTLSVLAQFDNPMRQPLIINSIGWTSAYQGVAFEKKCAAAIVPVANLKSFPNHENIVRVLYKSKVLPNQAFSAGPRISIPDQARIAAALVSPEGHAAIQRLLSASGAEQGLAFASKEEYTGLDVYLKDSWGYSR